MQTLLLLSSLLLAATTRAAAFIATGPANRRIFVTSLHSRPDASGAVQEAMDATETYGPTSAEARVAWDIVEELDASDNRCVAVYGRKSFAHVHVRSSLTLPQCLLYCLLVLPLTKWSK